MRALLASLALLPVVITSQVYLHLPQLPVLTSALDQRSFGVQNNNDRILQRSFHVFDVNPFQRPGNEENLSSSASHLAREPSSGPEGVQFDTSSKRSHIEEDKNDFKDHASYQKTAAPWHYLPALENAHFKLPDSMFHACAPGMKTFLPCQRSYRNSQSPNPQSIGTAAEGRTPKTSPSKRYLGIELPDYIASNYGGPRNNNQQLYQLKQRMRNVGRK